MTVSGEPKVVCPKCHGKAFWQKKEICSKCFWESEEGKEIKKQQLRRRRDEMPKMPE